MDLTPLETDGYVVVAGLVGEELLAPLRALAATATSPAPPVWGHQALWDVRQHPPVHALFAAAYGREDLRVSQDALGVHAPGVAGLPIHWDVDPRDPRPHRMFQGVLYVTDVGPAPFTCVPELYRHPDRWPGGETWGMDVGDAAVVAVEGRAGDFVLFDGALPHGRADNTTDATRVAQYVTMWPPGAWDETDAFHQEIWRSGRANPHLRRKPGWDAVQPWPPATLTAHGRSLLGL